MERHQATPSPSPSLETCPINNDVMHLIVDAIQPFPPSSSDHYPDDLTREALFSTSLVSKEWTYESRKRLFGDLFFAVRRSRHRGRRGGFRGFVEGPLTELKEEFRGYVRRLKLSYAKTSAEERMLRAMQPIPLFQAAAGPGNVGGVFGNWIGQNVLFNMNAQNLALMAQFQPEGDSDTDGEGDMDSDDEYDMGSDGVLRLADLLAIVDLLPNLETLEIENAMLSLDAAKLPTPSALFPASSQYQVRSLKSLIFVCPNYGHNPLILFDYLQHFSSIDALRILNPSCHSFDVGAEHDQQFLNRATNALQIRGDTPRRSLDPSTFTFPSVKELTLADPQLLRSWASENDILKMSLSKLEVLDLPDITPSPRYLEAIVKFLTATGENLRDLKLNLREFKHTDEQKSKGMKSLFKTLESLPLRTLLLSVMICLGFQEQITTAVQWSYLISFLSHAPPSLEEIKISLSPHFPPSYPIDIEGPISYGALKKQNLTWMLPWRNMLKSLDWTSLVTLFDRRDFSKLKSIVFDGEGFLKGEFGSLPKGAGVGDLRYSYEREELDRLSKGIIMNKILGLNGLLKFNVDRKKSLYWW